jgi:hypothetical protein
MPTGGSRNSGSHSRNGAPIGNNRETTGSNFYNRDYTSNLPAEQGVEAILPSSRNYLSTSHAGIMHGRKDGGKNTELAMSQHAREDLEVVPEAAGHLERPSVASNFGRPPPGRPPQDLRTIPYEEYNQYSDEFILDRSERLEGSTRMERSERSMDYRRIERRSSDVSRQDSASRGPSNMSVVSDVSYGDKPYHSMPVISLTQDSGSILPHLNLSQKSTCSMTAGSKRMAEKRASLLRSGNLLYCDKTQELKKKEDMALEFTRWGGRKDYSNKENDRKRKQALHKIHKRKVKAEKRKSLEEQESFRSIEPKRSSVFQDLWGFSRQDHLQYEQLIKEDKDRELVASYCEEPFWKIIFHFKGTVLRVIIEDVLFWLTLAVSTTNCSTEQ